MDNKKDFLYYISKSTIILPIVIVIIALALSPNKKIKDQFIVPTQSFVKPTTTASQGSINLKGPFICDFSYKDAKIQASIKDQKVFTQIRDANEGTSNYLLGDGCLYSWLAEARAGTKTCGLSPILSLIELSGSFASLPLPIDKSQIDNFIKSCKMEKIKDGEIFSVPKNVVFKNQGLDELLKPK